MLDERSRSVDLDQISKMMRLGRDQARRVASRGLGTRLAYPATHISRPPNNLALPSRQRLDGPVEHIPGNSVERGVEGRDGSPWLELFNFLALFEQT